MAKYLLILIIGLSLNSCATIFNKSTVSVLIDSDIDSLHFYINYDTTNWYVTPAKVSVKRSFEDLVITARHNGIIKDFFIESSLSAGYWLGNLFLFGFIGYDIDHTSEKQYTYPSHVILNFNIDTSSTGIGAFAAVRKVTDDERINDTVSMKYSIPFGNTFYLNNGLGYFSRLGAYLSASGIGFEISDKIDYQANLGIISDYPYPFPVGLEKYENYESTEVIYVDSKIGTRNGLFHFYSGFQYNRVYYNRKTTVTKSDSIIINDYNKIFNNFGLALSAYYQLTRNFVMGFNYYPSFISWNLKPRFDYSHLIFFELMLTLHLY